MGKTAFSGPVYGSKSLLWSYAVTAGATGASTALLAAGSVRVVPPYEDWFITEMHASASTCSSGNHTIYLKTEGGSTTIAPAPWGTGNGSTRAATVATLGAGTSTTISSGVTATATAGEYEGSWVPAGSTLRLVSSGGSAPSNVTVNVMGFVRFRNSTRGE